MQVIHHLTAALCFLGAASAATIQAPLSPAGNGRSISVALFSELEELARIVDISYCVGLTSLGIIKPFTCLSRCSDFPKFELITAWNTGPLLSDSCGYVALDHGKERIIVAFRGTYSLANTIADLSTVPQEYAPYPGPGESEHQAAGGDVSQKIMDGIDGKAKRDGTPLESEPKCDNCTVHMGFQTSWTNTRRQIMPDLEQQVFLFPHYKLNLVGHSLGGAVAALAGLDMLAHGWDPMVTTFGEPRVGNTGLVKYIDDRFHLLGGHSHGVDNDKDNTTLKFRRVTHVNDPVPLLPLTEWGFAMHAGEIHISKAALSPDLQDLEHCEGDNDPTCAAGQDPTVLDTSMASSAPTAKRDLLASMHDELHDVMHEPWGIPTRYRLWNMLFAHRDYFWRLGLCVPGGDPFDRKGEYAWPEAL
ncbi:hypothetical protein LTR36_002342 [Oleoguttula mirabilis]|uniref:Fungal lipase-type domain-containing protein n=1 Tax=Oleoguttula mirabilis TaxID=1507867 RepID=A0AAV9JL20_9PEZI|nr:hypothetical protein LTR36_002342 [Oleoguttula mirabilis]